MKTLLYISILFLSIVLLDTMIFWSDPEMLAYGLYFIIFSFVGNSIVYCIIKVFNRKWDGKFLFSILLLLTFNFLPLFMGVKTLLIWQIIQDLIGNNLTLVTWFHIVIHCICILSIIFSANLKIKGTSV